MEDEYLSCEYCGCTVYVLWLLPLVRRHFALATPTRARCLFARSISCNASFSLLLAFYKHLPIVLPPQNASSAQMTSRPMRKLLGPAPYQSSVSRWTCTSPIKAQIPRRCRSTTSGSSSLRPVLSKRHLAQVRPEPISELWFTASSPRVGPADELLGKPPSGGNGGQDHKPPDQRLLKLGKSTPTQGRFESLSLMLTISSIANTLSSLT